MYKLITQETNLKGQYLYYAKYTNDNITWENRYWFSPAIKRIYIRTQIEAYTEENDDELYTMLITEGFHVTFQKNNIPQEGTLTIQIDENSIISTSKQEIAKFLKNKIFKGMKVKEWRNYETNNTYTKRNTQYKKCMDTLKKLK